MHQAGRLHAGKLTWLTVTFAAASWAQTAPIVPRAKATGVSTIEQRRVYAPPDKGEFTIPLRTGGGAPNELVIETPMMCDSKAEAQVTVKYDKSKNTVKVISEFKKALPYRLSLSRPDNPSTAYNQHLTSVQNGKWQMWIVAKQFSFETNFYYDSSTLQLIGNEAEFPGGPPPNAIVIPVPTLQMLCTPMFEGKPNGDGRQEYTMRYDQMLDYLGHGGTYVAFLPYDLCKPDQYGIYYVNGGVSPSRAPNFDQVLQGIWEGWGMAISSSLEPDPKPSFLDSRDNIMIGWGGAYPANGPEGASIDPINGLLSIKTSCGTHTKPKFPPAYFNVCGG